MRFRRLTPERLAIIGLTILGSAAYAWGRQEPARSELRAAVASSARDAEARPPAAPAGALGVVLPESAADVAAPSGGRLVEVRVRIGDRVRAGDLLATLDTTLVRAELAAADAALRAQDAELRVALAKRESAALRRERMTTLGAQGLVSREEVETADRDQHISNLHAESLDAVAAERRAQASRLLAELRRLEVRAPFDGTVVARYVDPGAMVSTTPPQPILRLISTDRLFVRFAASELEGGRVERGSRVRVRPERPEGPEVEGRVERLAPELDPATGTRLAEAVFTESSTRASPLLAGTVVRVFLEARGGRP